MHPKAIILLKLQFIYFIGWFHQWLFGHIKVGPWQVQREIQRWLDAKILQISFGEDSGWNTCALSPTLTHNIVLGLVIPTNSENEE